MVDLTAPINLLAIAIGSVIAVTIALSYFLKKRSNKKLGIAEQDDSNPERTQKLSKIILPKETPEIRLMTEKPRSGPSDGTGSFMWFIVCVIALVIPSLLGVGLGLNALVAVLFFAVPAVVGVAGGYMFHRFRVSGPARDFDKMLKVSTGIGLHVGTDDKARLVGARRGSTGRWHFPNMEITADAIRKAIYPFYGNVLAIIHSVTDSQLNLEFLYYATTLNRNSELIGADGRPKLSHEIADTIQGMVEREEELMAMQEQMHRIQNGESSLEEVLTEQYKNILYPKAPRDMTIDNDALESLKEYWTGMMKDEGWAMKIELAEIARAMTITVQEKGYHIEFEKDMRGRLIGAHLVHDRVIDLHDFRNFLPTGGTAESSHLQSENARMAGALENGVSQQQYMRWLLIIMTPIMVGVMVVLIAYALKSI